MRRKQSLDTRMWTSQELENTDPWNLFLFFGAEVCSRGSDADDDNSGVCRLLGQQIACYWLELTRSGSTKPSLELLLPVFMAED